LSPGVGTGQVVNYGNLLLNAGDTLDLELAGTSATDLATGYDNFVVTGSVSLGSVALGYATLNATLVSPFVPTTGNRFTLIDNDAAEAVDGTFLGLAEGTVLMIGGSTFQISYQGGDGNDVVLTALSATNPTLEGTPGGDLWLVKQDTLNSGIVDVLLNG